jgi:hypothetical protein
MMMSERSISAAGAVFELRFHWRHGASNEEGIVTVKLRAKNPPAWYRAVPAFKWMFSAPEHPAGRCGRTREQAERYAHTARSLVAFMDSTGLRPSAAEAALWPELRCAPQPPFDHTFIWHDGKRRYMVTTEPYDDGEDVAVWCRGKGWQCHICPPGIGLWNPEGGTRMVLAAPPRRGVQIGLYEPRILAAMPVAATHQASGEG